MFVMIQIRFLSTHHLHVYVTMNHFLKSPQVLVAKIFRGVQLRLSVALIVNVKKDIDSRYGPGTSAWKSMALTREYKKRGGTYTTNSSKRGRLAQWRKERWIQVDPYVRTKKQILCGTGNTKHACRPLKRITKKTPITLDELIKLHTKQKILSLAKSKRVCKNNIRIDWKSGKLR